MFDYDTIFALVENDVALAAYYGGQGKTDAYSAKTYFDLGNKDAALQLVIAAAIHYGDAFSQFFNAVSVPYPWYRIMALFDALHQDIEALEAEPPPEVDMASIINAMLVAEPTQVRSFVGLVDAYRQSVWNKPFNKEYYAALAKGFMP